MPGTVGHTEIGHRLASVASHRLVSAGSVGVVGSVKGPGRCYRPGRTGGNYMW